MKRLSRAVQALILASVLFYLPSVSAGEKKTVLHDGELTVERGDFKELHYLIPDAKAPSRVEGNFTARGGYYDDINFYVFTQQEYVRWLNHYPHKSLFRIDKKKNGSFRLELKSEETYYFVFDNFFSTVSNKKIKFRLTSIDEPGEERK